MTSIFASSSSWANDIPRSMFQRSLLLFALLPFVAACSPSGEDTPAVEPAPAAEPEAEPEAEAEAEPTEDGPPPDLESSLTDPGPTLDELLPEAYGRPLLPGEVRPADEERRHMGDKMVRKAFEGMLDVEQLPDEDRVLFEEAMARYRERRRALEDN